MLDPDNPFWRPLWLRLGVSGVALGWGLFELATGSPGFAALFLAAGAWAVWRLLLTYDKGDHP